MRHIEGMTTRQLLLEGGLGDDAIDAMLVRGDLLSHDRGTYRLPGAPDDRRRLLVGALLTLAAPVAVTDVDALWVAGYISEPEGPVNLLLPHPRSPRHPQRTRVRTSTRFHTEQIHRISVVPTVSPPWALTDAAKTSGRSDFARLVTRGLGARWVDLAGIEEVLTRRGTFPACQKVRRLVQELRCEVSFSSTERRLALACRRAGMTVVMNHPVMGADGRVIRRADLWIAQNSLDIEVDGPHHWLPTVAEADRIADRRMQSVGATVMRFSVYEVDDDIASVVGEVEQACVRLQAA